MEDLKGFIIETSLGNIRVTDHASQRLSSRFGITTPEELLAVMDASDMTVLLDGVYSATHNGTYITHLQVSPTCGLSEMIFILAKYAGNYKEDRYGLLTVLTVEYYSAQTWSAKVFRQRDGEGQSKAGWASTAMDKVVDSDLGDEVRKIRERLVRSAG